MLVSLDDPCSSITTVAAASLVSFSHRATAGTLSGTDPVRSPLLFGVIFVPDIRRCKKTAAWSTDWLYFHYMTEWSTYGRPSVRKIRTWIIHLIQEIVNSLSKKWLFLIKRLIFLNFPMSRMMPGAFKMASTLLNRTDTDTVSCPPNDSEDVFQNFFSLMRVWTGPDITSWLSTP